MTEHIEWHKYYNHEEYPDYQTKEIVLEAISRCPHVNVIDNIQISIDDEIQYLINKQKLLGNIIQVGDKCDHETVHHDNPAIFMVAELIRKEFYGG